MGGGREWRGGAEPRDGDGLVQHGYRPPTTIRARTWPRTVSRRTRTWISRTVSRIPIAVGQRTRSALLQLPRIRTHQQQLSFSANTSNRFGDIRPLQRVSATWPLQTRLSTAQQRWSSRHFRQRPRSVVWSEQSTHNDHLFTRKQPYRYHGALCIYKTSERVRNRNR